MQQHIDEIRRTLINLDIVMSNRIMVLEEENKKIIALNKDYIAGIFLNIFYCLVLIGCLCGFFVEFMRDGKTLSPMWVLYILYIVMHIFAVGILCGYYRIKNAD